MTTQTHEQFKVFSGYAIETAIQKAELWASSEHCSPKSISLEQIQQLADKSGPPTYESKYVLTIGYRADQVGHGIKITVAALGQLTSDEGFERAIHQVVDTVDNLLCHDMFTINDGREAMMVMMSGLL